MLAACDVCRAFTVSQPQFVHEEMPKALPRWCCRRAMRAENSLFHAARRINEAYFPLQYFTIMCTYICIRVYHGTVLKFTSLTCKERTWRTWSYVYSGYGKWTRQSLMYNIIFIASLRVTCVIRIIEIENWEDYIVTIAADIIRALRISNATTIKHYFHKFHGKINRIVKY
jgi:hypothetical protein